MADDVVETRTRQAIPKEAREVFRRRVVLGHELEVDARILLRCRVVNPVL
jgi:hypothetical protein